MKVLPKFGLNLFPIATLVCFLSAILVGLVGTWLQSLGYMPAIGFHKLSPKPWFDLVSHPGFSSALAATLISGWGAVLLTLAITASLLSFNYHGRFWKLLERTLAPLLAVPHAAFAIGLLFLAVPSGWILRIFSPLATGFLHPPVYAVMKDSYGLGLMVALVIKEVPFLVFMSLSALGRIDTKGSLAVGRSLGYDIPQIWLKVILPQLYPKIRLSVFALMAYSLSVVDIAQILGPTTPPTLAVQVFRWFGDPDMDFQLIGAAGAVFILLLTVASIAILMLLEGVGKRIFRFWLTNGRRKSYLPPLKPLGSLIIFILVAVSLASILVLVVWSFAWRWRFPDSLPTEWSVKFWAKGLAQLREPAWNTVSIGFASSLTAIVLVIGCLENERSRMSKGFRVDIGKVLWLAYTPLLVPQIAFLFGIQVFLVVLRLDAHWTSLVWSHLLFVIPYVFLTLGPVYRAYDQHLADVAVTLGGSWRRAFFQVKLPILLRPILFSLAIGFSVSVAQYLPTLFVGAGRCATITTEAVTLASGSDRRIVAVYALCQLFAPLLVFGGAIAVPKLVHRHRAGMQI